MTNMQRIRIDAASPPDRERLAELYAADMAELGLDYTPQTLQQVVDETLELQGHQCHTWVARERAGGDVAGVLLAAPFWSFKFGGRGLWIESLYVDPPHRRQGIARRLVEHLMDWAEEQQIKGIELEAYNMNTAASILYRTLGFRRLARERYCFEFGRDG